jgi:hypothetical protein
LQQSNLPNPNVVVTTTTNLYQQFRRSDQKRRFSISQINTTKMINPQLKDAAELYALQAISLDQLIELIKENNTISDKDLALWECLKYANNYRLEYDLWVEEMQNFQL